MTGRPVTLFEEDSQEREIGLCWQLLMMGRRMGSMAHFVVPRKEHVPCWDCGYYGHRRGNKVCPNYDPSKWNDHCSKKNEKTLERVNVTSGEESVQEVPASGDGQMSSVSSMTAETPGAASVAVGTKKELVSCTVAKPAINHGFTFFQKTPSMTDTNCYILLDNPSACQVFKDKSLLVDIQPALVGKVVCRDI